MPLSWINYIHTVPGLKGKVPMLLQVPLVGGIPTPLKNMSLSVGMMKFPIYGKIKFMFQTTNHIYFPLLKFKMGDKNMCRFMVLDITFLLTSYF